MKINDNLWIEGGYYVDFDAFEQFRIIGPNNHLYCGLIDIPRHKITINSVEEKGNRLHIKATFNCDKINLYYPAMDDMRTARSLLKSNTFLQLRKEIYDRLVPQIIRKSRKNGSTFLKFKRIYGKNHYETIFGFGKNITARKISHPFSGFEIFTKSKNAILFTIEAGANDINFHKLGKISSLEKEIFDFNVFGEKKETVEKIWERTEIELKHLLEWGKTSGDRFGTIFPRDWMEAADLGYHDLTSQIRGYMYEQSLKNVNSKGEGWHEDVVGEFKYEYEISGRDVLNRHMIDIEPHYLIGIDYLPQDFWLEEGNRRKMHLVAKYILKQAKTKNYIIFKKLPKELAEKYNGKYYNSGNWRDSGDAYKQIDEIIAPFDVNAVFYPRALEAIKDNCEKLGFGKNELSDISKIYNKWKNKKEEYRYKNKDGKIAYAIALYGGSGNGSSKYCTKKMELNHIDESYLYTYCQGTEEELESFCKRLLDRNYFYTKSGPLITAKNNKYFYKNDEYHGLVIWIKQTAFVVLGLSKHLKIAIINGWPIDLQRLIKKTILEITEDTLEAVKQMGSVPEVYVDLNGKAVNFSQLTNVKNQGSEVQLWSSIGIRRIIRKYYELLTDKRYEI